MPTDFHPGRPKNSTPAEGSEETGENRGNKEEGQGIKESPVNAVGIFQNLAQEEGRRGLPPRLAKCYNENSPETMKFPPDKSESGVGI